MRITKAEFVRTMKAKRNCMIALTLNDPLALMPLYELAKKAKPDRTVAAVKSDCLIFSDESRLYIGGNAKVECYDLSRGSLDVYEVVRTEKGNDLTKFMYYVVAD